MNKPAIGKTMIVMVLVALAGSLFLFFYPDIRSPRINALFAAVGLALWLSIAWILLWRGKLSHGAERSTKDGQRCRGCGRWVPSAYLKEGRLCYECHRKSEKTKTAAFTVDEFPYKAELDRQVFEFLANEEKDMATLVQAMAESDGDRRKAQARYFKLRYQQMQESGEVASFMQKIIAEKHPRPGNRESNSHRR